MDTPAVRWIGAGRTESVSGYQISLTTLYVQTKTTLMLIVQNSIVTLSKDAQKFMSTTVRNVMPPIAHQIVNVVQMDCVIDGYDVGIDHGVIEVRIVG